MTQGPLIIVGCGGFGREVNSLVEDLRANGLGWDVVGFVDDAPSAADQTRLAALGIAHLGPLDVLRDPEQTADLAVAIGSPAVRKKIVYDLHQFSFSYPTLVHPAATVGRHVSLGAGAIIAPGARLSAHIVVGDHVHIDQQATVGHDCVISPFSRLNPASCVSGSVEVGEGALIGANATILPGVKVGEWSTVGAGAVVTHAVPPRTVVKGVPAR